MAILARETVMRLSSDIIDKLTSKDVELYVDSIQQALDLHYEVAGERGTAFMHNGQIFALPNVDSGVKLVYLHPSLHEKGTLIEKAKKSFDTETAVLLQYLYVLMRDCGNAQDVRDALPETLIPYVADTIGTLQRSRPEAYTIADDPVHEATFRGIQNVISTFLVSRLYA